MLARSPQLGGLAGNPALPPALLDVLIAAADDDLADDLARRDDLTPAQRDSLAARRRTRVTWTLYPADPAVSAERVVLPHLTPARAAVEAELAHALAGSPSTPTATVLWLADRFDLTWKLAGRPDLAPEGYERLARHPTPGIRATVAANPAIDVPLMRALAADEDHDVRRCLAGNPAIPLDLLTALAPGTRIGATLLPRIAAATPAEAELLAASPIAEVRMWLAERPDLPAPVLARLAADRDAKVLRALAPNPALDESRLRAMLTRHGARVLARIAANPSCGPALLHALATHRPPVPKALRKIAAHPNASAPTLLLCLHDDRARPIAARHPALPVPAILELLASPEPCVAEAAAVNPSLPPGAMAALLA